jgi:hypothetical protein
MLTPNPDHQRLMTALTDLLPNDTDVIVIFINVTDRGHFNSSVGSTFELSVAEEIMQQWLDRRTEAQVDFHDT